MRFKTSLRAGQILTNNELMKEFSVANSGGMRKSNKNNVLVIISDHTKDLYDDKYYGNELHYTGMGLEGDQELNYRQNKTLAESNKNGVDVHLFEVFKAKEYIYRGMVKLCKEPYQEIQLDKNNNERTVWIFPLIIIDSEDIIDSSVYDICYENKIKEIKKMSRKNLERLVKEKNNVKTSYRTIKTTTYIRDPYIAEYAKLRADGFCQLCEEKAPFYTKNNKPYLEAHHLKWLSKGGTDTIDNVVALCPNCHRKMHELNDKDDIKKLKMVLDEYDKIIDY